MKPVDHLLIGGPALNAWPAARAGRIRPGKGGGGGDGGAAQMEADRQARTAAAIEKINAIFNGNDVSVAGLGQAGAYDPAQTYYNADGSIYVPPTITTSRPTGRDTSPNEGMSHPEYETYTMPDQSAAQKAAQAGNLYTGTETTIKGIDRQGMYDQQQQAVTQLNQDEVLRQQAEAERQNRFGLARAGLSGGSADVDSNAEITRLQNEGLMKATGLGQQAGADLRTEDERTRQNLIGMAQAGIDTGQIQQIALAGLDANAANAKSATSGATIGNVFGDLTQAYLQNQQMQAFQNGYGPYQNKGGNINSTRTQYGGQVS